MAQPTGYQLTSYGDMIVNEPRTPNYALALRQAITPGCKVIDIGAGPGLFALLACQYGAGEAVAIEPHDSVRLLHQAAKDNGVDDRVHVVQNLSSAYSSDRRAEVIISDLRGILPLFEGHIPAIIDARNRLLGPGGILIPARDIMHIALVEHDKTRLQFDRPWLENAHGVDLTAGHPFAVNRYLKVVLAAEDLLSQSAHLLTLDYRTIDNPSAAMSAKLTAERDGQAHGFVIWFDSELGPGAGFSNAPGKPEQVYGQCFFPFERSIPVLAGDCIAIDIRADHVAGAYIWTWATSADRKGHEQPLTYRQSTFRGMVTSPARLAALSPGHVPPALPDHDVDRFGLAQFDGVASLRDIADRLAAKFPDRFGDHAAAFGHASRLAQRYRKSDSDRDEDVRQ